MKALYFGALLIILFSCSESDQDNIRSITVSACAKNINGTIEAIECNSGDSSLSITSKFVAKLNKKLPGPDISDVNESHIVISANRKGVINLKNGVNLSFAGMKCNHIDLKRYLDAFFINDKDARLVYLPTGYEENNIVYAYIWELFPNVEINQMQNNSNNIYGNPTHDTALFSKWCNPIEQPNHKYGKRFYAINKHAENLK